MPKAQDAALLLIGARQTGTALADLPAELRPHTLAEAYAIQDASIRLYGEIGGWKLSPNAPPDDYRCAAIFRSLMQASPADHRLPGQTGCEVEVEIALVLGRDLPMRGAPYAVSDVETAIESVTCGIEVLSSRYTDWRKTGRDSNLADMQANGAVIVAPDRIQWSAFDIEGATARIAVKGEVRRNTAPPSREKILGSLALLATHTAARGFPLTRGNIIMTGALAGPVPARAGDDILAGINDMQCRLILS